MVVGVLPERVRIEFQEKRKPLSNLQPAGIGPTDFVFNSTLDLVHQNLEAVRETTAAIAPPALRPVKASHRI